MRSLDDVDDAALHEGRTPADRERVAVVQERLDVRTRASQGSVDLVRGHVFFCDLRAKAA